MTAVPRISRRSRYRLVSSFSTASCPRRPLCIWLKRGPVCVYLPSLDLAVCMDVERNPGQVYSSSQMSPVVDVNVNSYFHAFS